MSQDKSQTASVRPMTRRAAVIVVLLAVLVGGALAAILARTARRARSTAEQSGFLGGLPLDDQYFDYVVLETKAELALGESDASVWAIGDSSCLFGFAAPQFTAVSGLSALNLGTFGYVSTSGHALLLEARLTHHALPSAVVVWVHPQTLSESDERNERYGYRAWLAGRLAAGTARTQPVLKRVNDSFGGFVRAIWLDQGHWTQPQMGRMVTPELAQGILAGNSGWFPTPAQPLVEAGRRAWIHDDARAGLRRIGALCAKSRTPVFVVVMPYVRGGSCDDDYQRQMRRSVAASMPGSIIVETVPLSTEPDVMQSTAHFGESEAVRVTRDVAAFVRERLGDGSATPSGP
jgi:hypothetical protein